MVNVGRLDNARSVPTPEGVDLVLRVAGPPARICAWGVDTLIRVTAYSAISTLLAALGAAGQGVLLVVVFLSEWFYPVLFELFWQGATPGKRALGLQALHDDGTPIGPAASVVRNFLRFADFLPFAYGFGLTSMMLSRDFQRLGDLAAGTVVVHATGKRSAEARALDLPSSAPEPPPIPLELDEQLALLEFAERQGAWSSERRSELAELLSPMLGVRGELACQRLLGIAHWLVGRRRERPRRTRTSEAP